MAREHIHFVTGKLAEHALRAVLEEIASKVSFDYSIDTLPITVAALMTPKWVSRHIEIPRQATRIVLPGYCRGDLTPLRQLTDLPIDVGPRDLREIPVYLGHTRRSADPMAKYDIEIIAEINHAPRLPLTEILQMAEVLRQAGANVIDVGCEPGDVWANVGECVRALKAEGHRVSIDSLQVDEIERAVKAGAELVLSVNSSNKHAAPDWSAEVVVIPDDPKSLAELDATVCDLANAGVKLRIDPILEPIGCGFAESVGRYLEVRRRYPDAEMMMGIGNLTELTDVDSAGVNFLLLGICQEVGIRSVLTTQVINWARTSVRECDVARRLVHFSVEHGVPPKHLSNALVMLRDAKQLTYGEEALEKLADEIRDNNYRILAEDEQIHLLSRDVHLADQDPFALFSQLLAQEPKNLDAGHAFYLGFEMAKALTALTLGKQYEQDQALDWGLLTQPEEHFRLPRHKRQRD